ncbi:FAD-binding protein [Peribacillus asahii]|uniref:UDP-N-acetylenolpyruvoylglucosamine reductase n=1 Tax=Peribacillus asahii TaxID=228899 RepID=A0A398BAU4_9BACI|nr:FAD-binding protein [Peribacillus asahii]RID84743.1 FAD-binding protein [Peribacillus asahii]
MSKENRIKSIQTDTLSKFKTHHHFENYGEIKSIDDYIFFVEWAKKFNKEIYILGNGSNTLFTKKKVKSLVLKNSIPKNIKCISKAESLFEVSSNVMMHEILNYCYKNSLDSFYFLASVPATLGGALAMNAGEGKHINRTIYDYVEKVIYIDIDNSVQEIERKDMDVEFRKTMFTGCQDRFIISAVFKFPQKDFSELNPIIERIRWAKKYQDNVAPNCGSVFNENNGRIMGWLKGFRVGKAQYSLKTSNWIKNKSSSPLPILALISIAKILHFVFGKKLKIEVIRVK